MRLRDTYVLSEDVFFISAERYRYADITVFCLMAAIGFYAKPY